MLFISHSSVDGTQARALFDELVAHGYDRSQLFLDTDAGAGLRAGAHWQNVLYEHLKDCDALILVCSHSWVASRWCFAEVVFAKALGKAIFPVVVDDCDTDPIVAEYQAVSVCADGQAAYQRLLVALDERHLGPADTFGWPPKDGDRCPYPGLPAFDETMAGVYFGREKEIRSLQQELRKIRTGGETRLLLIVGASGSGKSSLLRAGVLPHVNHKVATEWLVLPTLRYGDTSNGQHTIFEQLALNLAGAFSKSPTAPEWKAIRDRITLPTKESVGHFLDYLKDLKLARGALQSTVLLPVDQFEELLAPTAGRVASQFLEFIRALVGDKNGVVVIGTLRSDHLDVYEKSAHAVAPPTLDTWLLGPFPTDRIGDVIRKPAKRAALPITEELVAKLIADTPSAEALPLLAFTLEKLYRRRAADAGLVLGDYVGLGGLEGSVENAINGILRKHRVGVAERAALRKSFTMHLVQVDDRGEVARQTARWLDLPELAKPILESFVAERLLTRSALLPAVASDGAALPMCSGFQPSRVTVEVAHEAIFRCWDDLKLWLKTSSDILRWRSHVRRDQRTEPRWSGITRAQLATAREWPKNRRDDLTPEEVAWINSAIRRNRIAKLAVTLAGVAIIVLGAMYWRTRTLANAGEVVKSKLLEDIANERTKARQATAQAQATELALRSRAQLPTDARLAALLAIEAARRSDPPVVAAEESLQAALTKLRGLPLIGSGSGWIGASAFSADDNTVAFGGSDGIVDIWDISNVREPRRRGSLAPIYSGHASKYRGVLADEVTHLALSRDGGRMATVTRSGESNVRVWALRPPPSTPVVLYEGKCVLPEVVFGAGVVCLDDEKKVVRSIGLDGDHWVRELYRNNTPIQLIAFSTDGQRLVALSSRNVVNVIDASGKAPPRKVELRALASIPVPTSYDAALFQQVTPPTRLAISGDGKYLAVLGELPSTRVQPQQVGEVWDISQPSARLVLSYPSQSSRFGKFDDGDGDLISGLEFSPDSTSMLLVHNSEVRVWDLKTGMSKTAQKTLQLPDEWTSTAFSPRGENVFLGQSAGTLTAFHDKNPVGTELELLADKSTIGPVRNVVVSNSGRLLLASGDHGAAWLFRTDRGDSSSNRLQLQNAVARPEIAPSSSTAVAMTATGLWLGSLRDMTARTLRLPAAAGAGDDLRLSVAAAGNVAVVLSKKNSKIYVARLSSPLEDVTLIEAPLKSVGMSGMALDDQGHWLVVHDGTRTAELVDLGALDKGAVELSGYRGGDLLFSPRSAWLVSGFGRDRLSSQREPSLWRLSPGLATPQPLPGLAATPRSLFVFDRDDRWLVASKAYQSGGGPSELVFWSIQKANGMAAPMQVPGHTMPSAARFSPNGKWLVTFDDLPGLRPKKLQLWRLPALAQPIWERTFDVQSISCDFSPDSSWLTVGTDGTLEGFLLDLSDSAKISELTIKSGAGLVGDWQFEFSSDGRWFATRGYNASVRLWRIAEGRRSISLAEEDIVDAGGEVAFSPDSRIFAAADAKQARVFELLVDGRVRTRGRMPSGGRPFFLTTSSSRLFLVNPDAIELRELSLDLSSDVVAAMVGRNFTWPEWRSEMGVFAPYQTTFDGVPVHRSVVDAHIEEAEFGAKAGDYEKAHRAYERATSFAIASRSAEAANAVCWSGATNGFARVVLPAGQFAVSSDPNDANNRDTLGVARAIVGDTAGAIEDLEAYVEWADDKRIDRNTVEERKAWIRDLKAGKLPKELVAFGDRAKVSQKKPSRP